MQSSKYGLILFLILKFFFVQTATKKGIHPAVNICHRNDPKIRDCYCKSWITMVPLIKDGIPEMNIVPVEPVVVENVLVDFTQTQSIRLAGMLYNVTLNGMTDLDLLACELEIDSNGIQLYFDIKFHNVSLNSKFKAKGKFMLLAVDTVGGFSGSFTELEVKTHWRSTKYMKKGREHLTFTASIDDMTMKTMNVQITGLFPNNPELSSAINDAVSENIDVLYDEVKPIILQMINSISENLINNVYSLFPYDVLFPLN